MGAKPEGIIRSLGEVLRLTGARPRRWLVSTVMVSLILAGLDMLGVIAMLPLMQLVTGGAVEGPFLTWLSELFGAADVPTLLLIVAGLVTLTFIVKSLGSIAFRWWLLGRTTRVSALAASELMHRYVLAPYSAHRSRSISEIYRNINDATSQAASVLLAVVSLFTDVVTLVAILTILVITAPLPTLFAAALFSLFVFGIQRALRRRQLALGEEQADAALTAWQALMPGIEGFRETRLTSSAGRFVSAFRDAKLRGAHAGRQTAIMGDIPRYLLEVVFILAIIGIAGIMILTGSQVETIPVLGVFAAASMRVLPILTRATANVATIRTGNAGLRILVDTLDDLRAEGTHDESPRSVTAFDGDIELHRVSFHYPDADELILDDVSLTIPHRRTTAFVGSSGAGKSTLLDLVLGLLTPTSGEVLCGGLSIAEDVAGWHAALGVVPQDVFLANRTLAENIAFGVPRREIDLDRVRDAAQLALLDDVIALLPEGFDTMVGDRGVRLSGGQRQRVGLARALYRRPRVLILDEATSALDNATEHEIAQTLGRLQGTMTIVIVAHRLSTVRAVDQLFFLRSGRVAASGTFDEVRSADAEFARLVELGSLD